jgi:hypothetical protein
MLMVGKGFCTMMRSVVISKERVLRGVLTVISVLGLENAWFCMDKFHKKKLYPTGKDNFSFHEADMRCPLVLGESHAFYPGT